MTSKTVLITGAAQRIGAAIARDLHHHGWNVVIHYNQSADAASALVDELLTERDDSAIAIQADLLDSSKYSELITRSHGWKMRLDTLINNASAFYAASVKETSLAQWDELIGTNMKAPFFLSQHAIEYLHDQRGCIINIADIHADRPLKNHPVYCTAKAGLVMLTRALAKELGPEIRVNAISPGAILWPEDMPETTQDEILSRVPLKKPGNPQDIAGAVRYLIEDATYVTGQILSVDGGRTLSS